MGEIDAYSIIGNGGRAELTSQQQGIKVGNISASSSGDGNGGKVRLTSTSGNIETGSINTSSLTGEGGNVNIEAGGESIKIVNSLSRHDNEYSIYSAGATKNGKINIQQTGETDNYFEVGDATYNGTKGGIYAGLNANGVVNNLLGTTIVVGTYVDGNIKIVTPDSPASLRKAKQLAPEKATLPTTFNPVALSAIQGFIDKGNSALSSAAAQREYRNAIVALDNFRTIEFYQSQGNTSPPVPQLDSVSKIKSFLNAGDIAANTKSAMIYTFLSGTTQDNPYDGTSLNLFAVTANSDVIYRTIPLVNGQYPELLRDTVDDFRSGLRDFRSDDYKVQASRLYDLIFRPLKDALSLSKVNNLIFSTDSLFRTIPLAALYDNPTNRFLVQDFSSSVTPSFQVIEKDRYQSLKGANVIKMGATEAASDFALLPSVRTELEHIAKIELQSSPNIKHSPIYLNQAFSRSNFQKLIAQNDSPIIHLATHGVLREENSDGFVQLGTSQSSGLTDRLTESDIRQLNGLQNKELLVFSACQTVLSIGNISYGLAGAALVAGVKSSTGSCWDVSDEGNMILMTGFYQQLLGEGLSKTKALQKTQKAMLLKMVETTPVDGTTDKAELSINGIKVESSEYGQRNIKRLGNNPENYLDHPFYWCGTFLLGNPW
jgi:CHAT domain-containing protein